MEIHTRYGQENGLTSTSVHKPGQDANNITYLTRELPDKPVDVQIYTSNPVHTPRAKPIQEVRSTRPQRASATKVKSYALLIELPDDEESSAESQTGTDVDKTTPRRTLEALEDDGSAFQGSDSASESGRLEDDHSDAMFVESDEDEMAGYDSRRGGQGVAGFASNYASSTTKKGIQSRKPRRKRNEDEAGDGPSRIRTGGNKIGRHGPLTHKKYSRDDYVDENAKKSGGRHYRWQLLWGNEAGMVKRGLEMAELHLPEISAPRHANLYQSLFFDPVKETQDTANADFRLDGTQKLFAVDHSPELDEHLPCPEDETANVLLGPTNDAPAAQQFFRIPRYGVQSLNLDILFPDKNGFIINAGAKITSVAWASGRPKGHQYLALTTVSTADTSLDKGPPAFIRKPTPCSLQIWKFLTDPINGTVTSAVLSLIFCLKWGPALALCWQPRINAWKQSNEVGLLFGIFEDGKGRVIRVRDEYQVQPQHLLVGKPLFEVYLKDTIITCGAWLSPFEIIVACANGMVAIWNLNFLEANNSHIPVTYYAVHETYITDIVSLAPSFPHLIATASLDGYMKVHDLRAPQSSALFSTRARSSFLCPSVVWVDMLQSLLWSDETSALKCWKLREFNSGHAISTGPGEEIAVSTGGGGSHFFLLNGGRDGTVRLVNTVRKIFATKITNYEQTWFKVEYSQKADVLRILDGYKAEAKVFKNMYVPQSIYEKKADITSLCWNPNRIYGTWAAAGLSCGLLRVEDICTDIHEAVPTEEEVHFFRNATCNLDIPVPMTAAPVDNSEDWAIDASLTQHETTEPMDFGLDDMPVAAPASDEQLNSNHKEGRAFPKKRKAAALSANIVSTDEDGGVRRAASSLPVQKHSRSVRVPTGEDIVKNVTSLRTGPGTRVVILGNEPQNDNPLSPPATTKSRSEQAKPPENSTSDIALSLPLSSVLAVNPMDIFASVSLNNIPSSPPSLIASRPRAVAGSEINPEIELGLAIVAVGRSSRERPALISTSPLSSDFRRGSDALFVLSNRTLAKEYESMRESSEKEREDLRAPILASPKISKKPLSVTHSETVDVDFHDALSTTLPFSDQNAIKPRKRGRPPKNKSIKTNIILSGNSQAVIEHTISSTGTEHDPLVVDMVLVASENNSSFQPDSNIPIASDFRGIRDVLRAGPVSKLEKPDKRVLTPRGPRGPYKKKKPSETTEGQIEPVSATPTHSTEPINTNPDTLLIGTREVQTVAQPNSSYQEKMADPKYLAPSETSQQSLLEASIEQIGIDPDTISMTTLPVQHTQVVSKRTRGPYKKKTPSLESKMLNETTSSIASQGMQSMNLALQHSSTTLFMQEEQVAVLPKKRGRPPRKKLVEPDTDLSSTNTTKAVIARNTKPVEAESASKYMAALGQVVPAGPVFPGGTSSLAKLETPVLSSRLTDPLPPALPFAALVGNSIPQQATSTKATFRVDEMPNASQPPLPPMLPQPAQTDDAELKAFRGSRNRQPGLKRSVLGACEYCRSHKVKCSGTNPCDGCVKRGKPCTGPIKKKDLDRGTSEARSITASIEPENSIVGAYIQ